MVFMHIANEICPGFVVREEFKDNISKVFDYAIGYPHEGINLSKGLWLAGDVGTGKSTLLEIVRRFVKLNLTLEPTEFGQSEKMFVITNAAKACLWYSDEANGGLAAIERLTNGNRAFDELGSEPEKAKYFGTELNVMQQILQTRYDGRDKYTTHVTTNMTMEDVTARYGGRIEDRCSQMFNVITFKGYSFRQ